MNNNIKMMEMQIEKIAKKKFEYWKEEFMNQIEDFIDENRMIASLDENISTDLIKFFDYKWQEFKDKYLGFEE